VRARAEEVMTQFGIADVADRKVQDLSGGVRRRVQVAKMFMIDAPVIFLDEFSSGMDAILKRSVMDLLRAHAAQGRTIVLTTQILSEAEELCDDILIINKGRRVAHGDLYALKLLTSRLYDVTLSFDRVPEDLHAIVSAYAPERVTVAHNTVQLRLRDDESRVLDLVAALARRGRIVRVEIAGASLEDVFVELTQRTERQP
jgi:ABC-2 type transport system ATP-binding protein